MNSFYLHLRLGGFAGLVMFSLLILDPAIGGDRDPSADAAKKKELIRLQMINDMMFASDDFFGETRHLVYADQPLPPVSLPEASKSTTASETGGGGRPPPSDIDGGGGQPDGGGCPT